MSLDETQPGSSSLEPGARPPRAALTVVHSPDKALAGQRFELAEGELTLGREGENTIVVASDQASRRHARICATGGAHVLQDLDSTNGTFLNSKLVKEQALRHGDVIRVASTVLKYTVRA